MRLIRSIISLGIIIAISYTHCTGGLFAMPLALAADVKLTEEVLADDGSLFSKDITACFDDLMSHALEEDHYEKDHIDQNHESNCGEGAPCARQSQHILTVAPPSLSFEEISIVAAYKNRNTPTKIVNEKTMMAKVREGPLYEFANEAVRVLVKKE
jgi:hypothetical protein